MQSKTAEIKEILSNYYFYKMQLLSGTLDALTKEKFIFIGKCIDGLDERNRKLIGDFYFGARSKEEMANEQFCVRTTIYRRVNKIINKINALYKRQFP